MTPDELLAILRANVHVAVEALPRFQVALPWVDGERVSDRRFLRWDGDDYGYARVYYRSPPEPGRFYGGSVKSGWFTYDNKCFDTREAAKASVDATLREDGFELLDEHKPDARLAP